MQYTREGTLAEVMPCRTASAHHATRTYKTRRIRWVLRRKGAHLNLPDEYCFPVVGLVAGSAHTAALISKANTVCPQRTHLDHI
jgi:hypothetical protein